LTLSVQHVQFIEAGVLNGELHTGLARIHLILQHWTERAGLHRYQRGAAMLVLSRKKNESIIINDNITVTVIEIRGDKVRLGIEAPKHVTVHRREVYEAIQNQARSLDQGAKVGQSEP
jgi:carbon storage regulator